MKKIFLVVFMILLLFNGSSILLHIFPADNQELVGIYQLPKECVPNDCDSVQINFHNHTLLKQCLNKEGKSLRELSSKWSVGWTGLNIDEQRHDYLELPVIRGLYRSVLPPWRIMIKIETLPNCALENSRFISKNN